MQQKTAVSINEMLCERDTHKRNSSGAKLQICRWCFYNCYDCLRELDAVELNRSFRLESVKKPVLADVRPEDNQRGFVKMLRFWQLANTWLRALGLIFAVNSSSRESWRPSTLSGSE
jgi:hypothetical protein